MKKVGILLAVIGIIIGIVVTLMVVVLPMFMEAHAGELNVRLPAFPEFLLDISDTIRLHVVVAECVALTFFVAGLLVIRRAGLQRNSN